MTRHSNAILVGLALSLGMPLTAVPCRAGTPPQFVSPSDQAAIAEAVIDADALAYDRANKWTLVGGVFSCVGLGMSYLYPVGVPAPALAGKPPAYADAFRATYKSRNKGYRKGNAKLGCLVTPIGAIPLYLLKSAASKADRSAKVDNGGAENS